MRPFLSTALYLAMVWHTLILTGAIAVFEVLLEGTEAGAGVGTRHSLCLALCLATVCRLLI